MSNQTQPTRSYVSKNRPRPCDLCRSKKTACMPSASSASCRSCLNAEEQCVFSNRRLSQKQARSDAETRQRHSVNTSTDYSPAPPTLPTLPTLSASELSLSPAHLDIPTRINDPFIQSHSTPATLPENNSDSHEVAIRSFDQAQDTNSILDFSAASTPMPLFQHVNSLEPPFTRSIVQLCGTSSDMDPWLLRHCRYDEKGIRSLYKLQIRSVGGVPVEGVVPVHFTIVDENLHHALPPEVVSSEQNSLTRLNQELKSIVEPDLGRKLISLFLRFVFPSLPVISRSQTTTILANSNSYMDEIPTCLLSAIYASAIPFSSHDPSLYLCSFYEDSPVERLWDMVHESISVNMRAPRLATLQAALLYMHRPCKRSFRALSDHPSIWPFWGSIVGLASSLGLHLECRRWGIPAWEKRLRRRLWWAVYLEDTWRSLLLGRPPFIHADEWDVSELDDLDFESGNIRYAQVSYGQGESNTESGWFMMSLVRLTQIVSHIQHSFYTLKASQVLCSDFHVSISAAKPVRERLHAWYTELPDKLRIRPQGSQQKDSSNESAKPGAGLLHLLYLTSELFLYRAILRPLARSPPPAIIADEEFSTTFPDIWQHINQQSFDELPSLDFEELGDAAEAVINAAETCVGVIITFIRGLGPNEFDIMCYSWCRLCFATVTNFVTLLLVQASSEIHAVRSKYLCELWQSTLREQNNQRDSISTLGFIRLNMWQLEGIGQIFHLPEHVSRVLGQDIQHGHSL
ncbi:fungal-specific transcription factor domain-containing protein [Annulohypoxylon moriforme]|nr:fungal-specific transcription factor domain-containing protein [Annulohypoxylon moriforme]